MQTDNPNSGRHKKKTKKKEGTIYWEADEAGDEL